MKVLMTNKYKIGIGGVRAILEDKQKAIDFESGLAVEVDEEKLKKLKALGWGAEVKEDDSDSGNIDKKSKNRDTATTENK